MNTEHKQTSKLLQAAAAKDYVRLVQLVGAWPGLSKRVAVDPTTDYESAVAIRKAIGNLSARRRKRAEALQETERNHAALVRSAGVQGGTRA
jgi:hypothetical protein